MNKPMASWPFPLLLSEQPLKSRHFRFLVRRAMAVYLFITILEKKWKHNKRFFVKNESCLSLSAACLVCLGGTPDICHTSAAHHNIQPIFHLKQSAKYKYRHTNTNTDTNIQIRIHIKTKKIYTNTKTQIKIQKHRISAPPLQHTIAFSLFFI